MKLEKFRMRTYGDYTCSCGCGAILGYNSVTQIEYDICVGEETDAEGYNWRMFKPECWYRLKLDEKSLDEIYSTYQPAPYNE